MITRRRLSIIQEIPISIHGYVVGIGAGTAFIDELFIIDYEDKLGVDEISLYFDYPGKVYYPNSYYTTLLSFPALTITLTKDDTYEYVRYVYNGHKSVDEDKTVVVCEDSFISWNYIDESNTIQTTVETLIRNTFKNKNIRFIINDLYRDINVDYDEYNLNNEYYNIKINNPIHISYKNTSSFQYPVISSDGTSNSIPKTVTAIYTDVSEDYYWRDIEVDFDATIAKYDATSTYVYSVTFPKIPTTYYEGGYDHPISWVSCPENYYENTSINPFYYNYTSFI